MQFRRSANDPVLKGFLSAKDVAESARQLAILLTEHAEARIKNILMACLYAYFNNYERHPDFEDLYSEVKTKLVTYLEELKAASTTRSCKDFRGYIAGIAHNACNDYLRQMYPARTRLYKQVRDLLQAHPDFALWRTRDESNKSDWICGFNSWQEAKRISKAPDWLHGFYENPQAIIEALAQGTDIQLMELDDLLAAIFNQVGEPVGVDDLVSVIADLKGIRDLPALSFDSDEDDLAHNLFDARIRIDTVLEMREPLAMVWEGLCQLPRDEFKSYILYARDMGGEDLITPAILSTKVIQFEDDSWQPCVGTKLPST